ncbi:MAG: hypothetical protein MRZ88_02890 [Firmicutes bacterium]|nr:hypothetical protein [Bacillota bacterium]
MKNEQEKDNEAYEKYVRYRKAKADYERNTLHLCNYLDKKQGLPHRKSQ